MSYELITVTGAAGITFDPQTGASIAIPDGGTLSLTGDPAGAISVANGGATTLQFNIVIDPSANNILSQSAAGLLADITDLAINGINDATDAAFLAGETTAGVAVKWQLANTLIPFGTAASGWGADGSFKYSDLGGVDGRLSTPRIELTNAQPAGAAGQVVIHNSTTDDLELVSLTDNDLLTGSATGDAAVLTSAACNTLVTRDVAGLGINKTTGAWEPALFGERVTTRTIAASGTLVPATDALLLVDATAGIITVTLASPAACEGNHFYIKKVAGLSGPANAVVLTPASGQIDGGASFTFDQIKEAYEIIWDGTNWWIV